MPAIFVSTRAVQQQIVDRADVETSQLRRALGTDSAQFAERQNRR